MANEKRYRLFLNITLTISILALGIVTVLNIKGQIPSNIMVQAGTDEQLDFDLPATGELHKEVLEVLETEASDIPSDSIKLNLTNPITLRSNTLDNYTMDVKLFGVIPLKSVDIQVINDTRLIPAGIPIGIYVKTDGVLVVGTGEFTGIQGETYSPAENLLQSGDYIETVDNTEISGKKELTNLIAESDGTEMIFKIRHGNNTFERSITPKQDASGTYKIGIWVRDNAQGIGTLTYISEDKEFGALGHGINDVDTSGLMNLSTGTVYDTQIISIKKGTSGTPGELLGLIDYSTPNSVGTITKNTAEGIFGICDEALCEEVSGEAIPVGLKQDVVIGPAQIISSVSGTPTYYDIAITRKIERSDNVNREIELTITDDNLLALTGGIVQGMSGAPIIQNGKIVGAVTHVLVKDPTKGYGIFIENMLEQ